MFHRPFLDEDKLTPERESDIGSRKQTSCVSNKRHHEHSTDHSVSSVKDENVTDMSSSGTGCANGRFTTSDDSDIPVCDGRLSAALGLISLGVINEQSHSNSESSVASHGCSSPAGMNCFFLWQP